MTTFASSQSAIEVVIRRDRVVIAAGLAVLGAIAWAYMFYLAQDMTAMMIPLSRAWSLGDFSFQFIMWAVMMVAMMTPSAAPMILVFASAQRKRRDKEQPFVNTSVFVAGYLVVWTGFAL
jgi:predicted metal-binding membrane protein